MRKKSIAFILLAMLLTVTLFGCKNSNMPSSPAGNDFKPTTMEEMAQKEKELLPKYEELHTKISDSINKFNQGQITREVLNQELNAIKPQFEQTKKVSRDFYNNYRLNKEDRQKALFLDGLVKGNSIISILSNMITIPVEGETVIIDNKKDEFGDPLKETIALDDNQLKKFFTEQEEAYQQDLGKLKKALSQFNK